MTQQNISSPASQRPAPLIKWMLAGGGIALLLISLFLYGAGEPDPGWPRYWYMRPLIIVPVGGALGGGFLYFVTRFLSKGTFRKVLGLIIGLMGYVFFLWIFTVLGLDGTMWD